MAFNQTIALAKRLQDLSQFRESPHPHVGIYFDNSIEYIVAFYATVLAGGVCVPVAKYHTDHSLKNLCNHASVSVLLACENLKQLTDFEFVDAFEFCKNIKSISINSIRKHESHCRSLAMMLFTSGTTGDPKAVMLSHQNVLANRESIQNYLPISKHEKALAAVPFSHALGNSVLQTHLLSGAELFIQNQLHFPGEVVDALREHKCTSVSAVPEFFDNLIPILAKQQALPDLKYMAIAGGKMKPDSARKLSREIAPAKLFLMYGQTEATARLAYLPPEKITDAPETIGLPIPGVTLEIFDQQNNVAGLGIAGTLCAKGDNVMLGYWDDKPATYQVIKNGWLNTGDLARRRSDGMIEICGRENGLVKVQGFRFHTFEIEKTLSTMLPNASLVAIDFDFYGKTRIALFAKPNNGSRLEKSFVNQCCRQQLPKHMLPQRIEIVEQWPLNGAGKIDRISLQNRAAMTNRSRSPTLPNPSKELATN